MLSCQDEHLPIQGDERPSQFAPTISTTFQNKKSENCFKIANLFKFIRDHRKGFVDRRQTAGNRHYPLRTWPIWYVDFRTRLFSNPFDLITTFTNYTTNFLKTKNNTIIGQYRLASLSFFTDLSLHEQSNREQQIHVRCGTRRTRRRRIGWMLGRVTVMGTSYPLSATLSKRPYRRGPLFPVIRMWRHLTPNSLYKFHGTRHYRYKLLALTWLHSVEQHAWTKAAFIVQRQGGAITID